MKTYLAAILCFFLGLFSVGAFAQDAPTSYSSCIACHGAAGEGNTGLSAPALAGQDAKYLERQLKNFKSGVRGSDAADQTGTQMKAMASMLSDEDIPIIATFLSQLPLPVVVPSEGANMKNGNNFYQSKCGACHGSKAQGNSGLNSPALSGLDAAYLTRQFANFQKGLRGTHSEDTYGRQMKMMSTSLPGEKDLTDVIAFMHSLGAAE
jgi:cytochrome c553